MHPLTGTIKDVHGGKAPGPRGEMKVLPRSLDEEKEVAPSVPHEMSWATKISSPLPIK